MTNSQACLFLIYLFTGLIIGIVFDLFRVSRRSFKTGIIITSIEDIIFWMITGIIILYCIFRFNNGVIRGYMFVGIFLGILFYSSTLSSLFVKINTALLGAIKKVILILFRILCKPFKVLINICKFMNKKIAKFAKKTDFKEGFSKKV